jgi:hypothetical protein
MNMSCITIGNLPGQLKNGLLPKDSALLAFLASCLVTEGNVFLQTACLSC